MEPLHCSQVEGSVGSDTTAEDLDPPQAPAELTVDAVPRAGGFDLALHTPEREAIATARIEAEIPGAFSPDGAFLTVGYGRPFAVCADYTPPSPAPASFEGVRIDVGPPPPFEVGAVFEHTMRHQ